MKISLLLLLSIQLMALHWEHDFNQAKRKALKQNKPIFFLLSQRECGWCEYYKNNALSHPQIQQYLEKNFITLELYNEDEAFPLSFKAKATPATWLLYPNAQPMFQIIYGALKAKTLAKYLQTTLKKNKVLTK